MTDSMSPTTDRLHRYQQPCGRCAGSGVCAECCGDGERCELCRGSGRCVFCAGAGAVRSVLCWSSQRDADGTPREHAPPWSRADVFPVVLSAIDSDAELMADIDAVLVARLPEVESAQRKLLLRCRTARPVAPRPRERYLASGSELWARSGEPVFALVTASGSLDGQSILDGFVVELNLVRATLLLHFRDVEHRFAAVVEVRAVYRLEDVAARLAEMPELRPDEAEPPHDVFGHHAIRQAGDLAILEQAAQDFWACWAFRRNRQGGWQILLHMVAIQGIKGWLGCRNLSAAELANHDLP